MLNRSELRKLSSRLKANPGHYMDSFRENLHMYIDHKDITLAEIADLADIPESTLKSFVYGTSKDCNLSTAVKLARVFGVSVDELVGCGTISPQTCDSLQVVRKLPEAFTYFVRWLIHYHYDTLHSRKITSKAIEIMAAECAYNGNLKMTNHLELLDVSDLSDDIRPKIFMGIRFPCSHYAPHYFENDIALLANDRAPKDGEHVFVGVGDNMWIMHAKMENVEGKLKLNYYSIRDGKFCVEGDKAEIILGYVAHVHRETTPVDDAF